MFNPIRIMQVLGERNLLQQEVLSELAESADSRPPFIHIAVRLADIQSAYFSNAAGQQLTFDLGGSDAEDKRPRRSALTSALAQGANAPAGASSNRQVACPQVLCTNTMHIALSAHHLTLCLTCTLTLPQHQWFLPDLSEPVAPAAWWCAVSSCTRERSLRARSRRQAAAVMAAQWCTWSCAAPPSCPGTSAGPALSSPSPHQTPPTLSRGERML